tara:strand:+ start:21 stop:122 length:102 start_codon:yes stop_codon:yes gene_type:complete
MGMDGTFVEQAKWKNLLGTSDFGQLDIVQYIEA